MNLPEFGSVDIEPHRALAFALRHVTHKHLAETTLPARGTLRSALSSGSTTPLPARFRGEGPAAGPEEEEGRSQRAQPIEETYRRRLQDVQLQDHNIGDKPAAHTAGSSIVLPHSPSLVPEPDIKSTSATRRNKLRELAEATRDTPDLYMPTTAIGLPVGRLPLLPVCHPGTRIGRPTRRTYFCARHDGAIWDTGCEKTTISSELFGDEFQEFLQDAVHDPYRNSRNGSAQLEASFNLLFSNRIVEIHHPC